jgi:hypothetical protein
MAIWEGAPLSREGVVRVGEGPGVRVPEAAAPTPTAPALIQRTPDAVASAPAPGVETPGYEKRSVLRSDTPAPAAPVAKASPAWSEPVPLGMENLGSLPESASSSRAPQIRPKAASDIGVPPRMASAPSDSSAMPVVQRKPESAAPVARVGEAPNGSAGVKPGVSTPGAEASLRPIGTPKQVTPSPVQDSRPQPRFESVAPSGLSDLSGHQPGVETPGFTPALTLGASDPTPLQRAVNPIEFSSPPEGEPPGYEKRSTLRGDAPAPTGTIVPSDRERLEDARPVGPTSFPSLGFSTPGDDAAPPAPSAPVASSARSTPAASLSPAVRSTLPAPSASLASSVRSTPAALLSPAASAAPLAPAALTPVASLPPSTPEARPAPSASSIIQRTPDTTPLSPTPVRRPTSGGGAPSPGGGEGDGRGGRGVRGLGEPATLDNRTTPPAPPAGYPSEISHPAPAPVRHGPAIPAAIQRRSEITAVAVTPALRTASEQPPALPPVQPSLGRRQGEEASSVASWEGAPLSREGVVRVGEGPGVRVPEAAAPTPPASTLIQRTPDAAASALPPGGEPPGYETRSALRGDAPTPATPIAPASPERLEAGRPAGPTSLPSLGFSTPGDADGAPEIAFDAEPSAPSAPWVQPTPAWQQDLLAQMDNLLIGRPGPNLLPPAPPASLAPLSPLAAADLSTLSTPEIAQREPTSQTNPAAASATPPRIKGTALEQELLAQVDRLLLGRPGPNTDFLALAAQAPLRTPDQVPNPIPIPDSPRQIAPTAETGPVWEVAAEPLPAPVRPVPAPRTQVQQPAAEPVRKPSFEVTIGRLEVIAPPPQMPQQQQPRRPAPKTSLQDYLDRRRVGR